MNISPLALILKLSLSILLINYALGLVDVNAVIVEIKQIPAPSLWLIFFMALTVNLLGAARFYVILKMMNVKLKFNKALEVTMLGAFFGQTMVSFVSGDAVRSWRLVHLKIPFAVAIKGIIFDRLLGFSSIIAVILLCLPFLLDVIPDRSMQSGLIVALISGIIAIAGIFIFGFLPRDIIRWRVLRWAIELSESAISMLRDSRQLTYAALISLVVQFLNILVLYLSAQSLSISVSYHSLLLIIPPVLLLSMLPISVAGWGVRESAMVLALALYDIPAHQSILMSVCFGLAFLAASLPGGIIFLLLKTKKGVDGE